MTANLDPGQGVEHEPHFQRGPLRPDPSAYSSDRPPAADPRDVDHTVWDEPALAGAAAPAGATTYAAWLTEGRARASASRAWRLAVLLAAGAGPWAVLGAFFGGFEAQTILGLVAVVVLAPIVEEFVKVSAAMITIERRPFCFTHRGQILLACTASGLVFAMIENQLYFHVYLVEPNPALIAWRNSVCVLMHTGCSLIAGLGLVRMWEESLARRARPKAEHAAGAVTIACVIHGTCNFLATLIDPVFK
jgi:hypothetical protein